MKKPRIAIISFPGNNGDTENLRCFWRNGFDAFVFRWNDSRGKLDGVDGYYIGAGFSFEDRGRAGMVAARDPLFAFLHEESERGKVIVGHCNGCQMLVESGLIPLGRGLKMCMARNVNRRSSIVTGRETGRRTTSDDWYAPGFLNEWIWITPSCARDRCATSDWVDSTHSMDSGKAGSPFNGAMHIPIAHGEGRFVTKDPELIAALEENDQIAFRYCDAGGNVSEDPSVTLNGSTGAIAGICNPAGNVVAMMPHAERTVNGDPYFQSMKKWIEEKKIDAHAEAHYRAPLQNASVEESFAIPSRPQRSLEILIDTIIVNNEERTVEQAARKIVPDLRLKQFRYLSPTEKSAEDILATIALFNPNKEIAYVRKDGKWSLWDSDAKSLLSSESPLKGSALLRRDEPDTEALSLGNGSETGVCYAFEESSDAMDPKLQEIFSNPHASKLEKLVD